MGGIGNGRRGWDRVGAGRRIVLGGGEFNHVIMQP